jgi:hypothetical protein
VAFDDWFKLFPQLGTSPKREQPSPAVSHHTTTPHLTMIVLEWSFVLKLNLPGQHRLNSGASPRQGSSKSLLAWHHSLMSRLTSCNSPHNVINGRQFTGHARAHSHSGPITSKCCVRTDSTAVNQRDHASTQPRCTCFHWLTPTLLLDSCLSKARTTNRSRLAHDPSHRNTAPFRLGFELDVGTV